MTTSEQPAPVSSDATRDFLTAVDVERQRLSIPGAIVHVNSPTVGSLTHAFGVADVRTATPLAVDSRMRAGSVTKVVVGTMILQLVDSGELDLDHDVRAIMPDLSVPPGVTVRHLLAMTSGLPDYTSDAFIEALWDAPDRVWSPEELLDTTRGEPQHFAPGTSWEYCNSGYIVLGLIIEHLTGRTATEVARDLVFEPLGMVDSDIAPPDRPTVSLQSAPVRGYHPRDGQLADATHINMSWAWTAGSLVSTAADLARLVEAVTAGELLSDAAQRERLDTLAVPGASIRYGLGIADFDGLWGHNGSLPGFQSFAGYAPASGTTIVAMTNVDDSAADNLAAFIRTRLATEGSAYRP